MVHNTGTGRNKWHTDHQKTGEIMVVTFRRAAMVAVLMLFAAAAVAYGTPDGAGLSATDAESAGSVIWANSVIWD
jgi:hypothetical protein